MSRQRRPSRPTQQANPRLFNPKKYKPGSIGTLNTVGGIPAHSGRRVSGANATTGSAEQLAMDLNATSQAGSSRAVVGSSRSVSPIPTAGGGVTSGRRKQIMQELAELPPVPRRLPDPPRSVPPSPRGHPPVPPKLPPIPTAGGGVTSGRRKQIMQELAELPPVPKGKAADLNAARRVGRGGRIAIGLGAAALGISAFRSGSSGRQGRYTNQNLYRG